MSSLLIDPMTQIPVDAEMANLHLRIGGDDDLQLVSHEVYLKAGAEYVETQTDRTLSARQHVWTLPRFPYSNHPLILPRGKTVSVASIVYYASDAGPPITLTGPSSNPAGTDYQEDLSSENGGRIRPNPGFSWPTVSSQVVSPVVVTFTAGYQAPAEVPKPLQVAVMTAAAQYLEDPEGGADLNINLPFTLLSPYRIRPV